MFITIFTRLGILAVTGMLILLSGMAVTRMFVCCWYGG
jgi:hypothetical protein